MTSILLLLWRRHGRFPLLWRLPFQPLLATVDAVANVIDGLVLVHVVEGDPATGEARINRRLSTIIFVGVVLTSHNVVRTCVVAHFWPAQVRDALDFVDKRADVNFCSLLNEYDALLRPRGRFAFIFFWFFRNCFCKNLFHASWAWFYYCCYYFKIPNSFQM